MTSKQSILPPDQYYVISVKHTYRDHNYITVWRPNNHGYGWALSHSGKYSKEQVLSKIDYYNGGPNIAVPCTTLDEIAVPPLKGHHDNDLGPCVENNQENWQRILKAVIAPTKYPPNPEYKRVRKRKSSC